MHATPNRTCNLMCYGLGAGMRRTSYFRRPGSSLLGALEPVRRRVSASSGIDRSGRTRAATQTFQLRTVHKDHKTYRAERSARSMQRSRSTLACKQVRGVRIQVHRRVLRRRNARVSRLAARRRFIANSRVALSELLYGSMLHVAIYSVGVVLRSTAAQVGRGRARQWHQVLRRVACRQP